MIQKNELLESKEFWDELFDNAYYCIRYEKASVKDELNYLKSHIDELLKNLKPQANELCPSCGSDNIYTHFNNIKRCLNCDKLI